MTRIGSKAGDKRLSSVSCLLSPVCCLKSPRRLQVRLEIADRRVLVHAVAEVEDVAVAAARLETLTCGLDHLATRAALQDPLVDIPLKNQVRIGSPRSS